MAHTKRISTFDGLLGEILASTEAPLSNSGSSGRVAGKREVEALSARDYGSPLRGVFNKGEIRELVLEARRKVWPNLNKEPLRLGSPQEFLEAWSPLGIEFRMTKLRSAKGLALLGFYVGKSPVSKRPLICVNTAHHRAAMSAAFAHEMGHHLSSGVFGLQDDVPHKMAYLGFADHLEDPPELAADIFVSLGIFPKDVARKCFDKGARGARVNGPVSPSGVQGAVAYIANKYGFNADPALSQDHQLQYLAGVLHYARLRKALFDEFDL